VRRLKPGRLQSGRRGLAALAAGLMCAAGAALVTAPTAGAADGGCLTYDQHHICVVSVGSVTGGSLGGTYGGGGAQGCTVIPAEPPRDPKPVPCTADGLGVWVQANQCYEKLEDPQPPKTDPAWQGHTNGAIYQCASDPRATLIDYAFPVWSATAPGGPTAYQLALQAYSQVVVPDPVPGRYPEGALADGRPFTVVNADTWYWTSAGSYSTQTQTAGAPGLTATVVVTPAGLRFTPGDGSPTVSCAGPGVAWQPADGLYAASPDGCDYRYTQSSVDRANGELTATYAIRWNVSWSASDGEFGTFPSITTTTNSTFAVIQVQTLVVPNN
jgi:hypothetical protein